MRPIAIIGAGGFGRETAALVHAIGSPAEVIGFFDDAPELAGMHVAGIPVLGAVEEAAGAGADLVVTTGSPRRYDIKRLIVERLDLPSERYAVLVHPAATIGTAVEIGEGSVILAGVVATHAVSIGRHVGIMPNVVLTHDGVVEDYAIIGAGVTMAGGVTVGAGAYIGAAVSLRGDLTIGPGAMVGMGAVVLHDVPAGEVWAGVPARQIR